MVRAEQLEPGRCLLWERILLAEFDDDLPDVLTRFSGLLFIPSRPLLGLECFTTGIGKVTLLTLNRTRPLLRFLNEVFLMAAVVSKAR